MNDHTNYKNNKVLNADSLSEGISKNNNVEANSPLENDNDVMFVNEAPLNMDIVKNEPNEDATNMDHNKAQVCEISTVSDIKTETPSPEPCVDLMNTDDISENTANSSEINHHNNVNNSLNIHNERQFSSCKHYFDEKEYFEHSKCCNDNISKPNVNIQKQKNAITENSSTSNAGLHSTLDIEIKDEPENGENCNADDGNSSLKPRRKKKLKAIPKDAIPCEICDTIFGSGLDYALHSIVHSNDGKYHCFMCDYSSRSAYDFKNHVRKHDETKFRCEVCKEEFTDKREAEEHKYLHTGETPFECETCGKRFMFSWLLSSHRRAKHWEVLIGMPIPKYDPNAIHYKHHIYSTMDVRRHKYYKGVSAVSNRDLTVLCEICGKRLSSMERLKFHLRVHTGYKPFVCTYCAKPFSRREQLREHERVHTGERPYICRFCGKGFTQRSPLRIHERMHTGERPYQCRLCDKGYVSKGAVDIHMKTCKGK